MASIVVLLGAALAGAPQQIPQAEQRPSVQQKDEAGGNADIRNKPQQDQPNRVIVEGPVAVVNQPNPGQQQRDADQQAQARFENLIQIGTLIFVALAAAGAIGAYFENRRSANAAEIQVSILKRQVADAQNDVTQQRQIALDALLEMRKSADATNETAQAARVNAGVAISVANQADRAWLTIKASLVRPIEITESGVWIQLRLSIRNTGRSAAQYAQVIASAMLDDGRIDGQAELTRIINANKDTARMAILPGTTLHRVVVLEIPMKDIEEAWAKSPQIMALPVHQRRVDTIVFGCVRYTHGQPRQAPHYSGRDRVTSFGYHIARIDPDSREDEFLAITLGRWDAAVLRLIDSPHGFSHAD